MNTKLLCLLAIAFSLLSCENNDERIYNIDELPIEVDWAYSGWDYVKNETPESLVLITEYLSGQTLIHTVEANGVLQLTIGCAGPGNSIDETIKTTIRLKDGTEIICSPASKSSWSERFYYTNVDKTKDEEIVEVNNNKVRRELINKTHHIDNLLIDLYRQEK